MKLLKAKEIIDLNIKEAGKRMPADCLDALKLGREAISRILSMRGYNINQAIMPLIGETRNETTKPKL